MTSIFTTGISRLGSSISIGRSTVTALVLAAGTLMLGGCMHDSPVESSAAGVRPPAVGSVFIYRFRSSFNGEVTECHDTVTVEKAGLTLGGRSNVMELKTDGISEGYSYICYGANGDVSLAQVNGYMLTPATAPHDVYWVNLPLATRSMTTACGHDSTEADGVMQPSIVYEIHDLGAETVCDGGISIPSEKFEVEGRYAETGGAHILTRHYWISTATGMPTKSTIVRDGMLEETVLVSQTIK